jgi:hypothetical protein
MAGKSKLRRPSKEHFEMRQCVFATDTRASGTPHGVANGGPQAVLNSVSPVREWIAKGVELEWWSAAGFCMFQRFESADAAASKGIG